MFEAYAETRVGESVLVFSASFQHLEAERDSERIVVMQIFGRQVKVSWSAFKLMASTA